MAFIERLYYFLDSSGDRVSLLCVDKHPTQPHLLAAGGQDGVLSIWDMRQELYPVTLLEAHAAESKTCCVVINMLLISCYWIHMHLDITGYQKIKIFILAKNVLVVIFSI